MNASRLREIILLQAFQTGDTAKAMAELIGAFHRAVKCDQCGNDRTLHPTENFYECFPCRQRQRETYEAMQTDNGQLRTLVDEQAERITGLTQLIRQSASECVSDGGSDDPKIHPPETSLLLRWYKAIGDEPRLPLECIRCGESSGPIATVDADHAGYVCSDCMKDIDR